MALILEQGFNIKRGQEEAFQKWTEETDELTKKASPPGVEYLGTYIAMLSSEKEAGEYRTLGASSRRLPSTRWRKRPGIRRATGDA